MSTFPGQRTGHGQRDRISGGSFDPLPVVDVVPRTAAHGRTGGRNGHGQRQTVTEGRRTGGRWKPGHGCGRA